MPKGMQAIYTQTMASSSATTATFNNIPQTYTDLKLYVSVKTYNSVAPYENDNIYMRFNSDSSSLYSTTIMYSNNAALNGGKNIAGNAAVYVGTTPTAVGSSSMWGNIEIDIPNYATKSFKQVKSLSSGATNTSTVDLCYEVTVAGLYRAATPITSIQIGFGSAFYIGTEITLYGIAR